MTLGQFLAGLAGGFLAWLATTVLGGPILQFRKLRSRTAVVLERYTSPDRRRGKAMDGNWLAEGADELRDCAATLLAFAATHRRVAALLRHCGIDIGTASEALYGLSNGSLASPNANLRAQCASALRLWL
jgi:hypothetical protein